jgi:hypothetical protein
MTDDLSRIPFLIELARRTRAIIDAEHRRLHRHRAHRPHLAATGNLAIGSLAALYHFVGDIFVIANSFRLFRFGEDFAASPPPSPRNDPLSFSAPSERRSSMERRFLSGRE